MVMRMKAVIFAFLVSLTACASTSSGPRRINVHAVRMEIKHTIEASPGDAGPREITSMGKVTTDSAVVYTATPVGRREETWVKGPQGWALNDARDVAAAR